MIVIIRPAKREAASFTKDVWFLLGREGGRWTLSEILSRMDAKYSRRNSCARSLISNMVQRGLIARYPGQDGAMTYGVTRTCKIPQNLTLAEIEQLIGIRFVESKPHDANCADHQPAAA